MLQIVKTVKEVIKKEENYLNVLNIEEQGQDAKAGHKEQTYLKRSE